MCVPRWPVDPVRRIVRMLCAGYGGQRGKKEREKAGKMRRGKGLGS